MTLRYRFIPKYSIDGEFYITTYLKVLFLAGGIK